jgi:glyoxylase-like metal-dependent hydrolase (beta-lactamase superfamily II)
MHEFHPIRNACVWVVVLHGAIAGAQGGDAPKVTAEPLAGSVYLLRGPEANVVASVGEDGIVVVDDQEPGLAEPLQAALKGLSAKPVRFVINTHVHEDHTSGNEVFQRVAPVIAHRNVRTRMASAEPRRAAGMLPSVVFDDELLLFVNGEEIRLLKLPAGHTDGDVVVFFKNANVVHMGDVFMLPAASYVDRSNGGTIVGLIDALEFVLPQIPENAKITSGHGGVASRAEVKRGLEVLKEMKGIVEAGIAGGKTMEQLVAEKPFEKYRGVIATWAKTDSYVGRFYRELAAPPVSPPQKQ